MDEIAARLKDTTDKCLETYNVWFQDKKATEPTAELKEAVHELRKVASRLEIEMAKNEREELAQRPIPIPPHRSQRKAGKRSHDNNGGGNAAEQSEAIEAPSSDKPKVEVATKRRVVRRKKTGSDE